MPSSSIIMFLSTSYDSFRDWSLIIPGERVKDIREGGQYFMH